jgi:S1-C subfamily serine protease
MGVSRRGAFAAGALGGALVVALAAVALALVGGAASTSTETVTVEQAPPATESAAAANRREPPPAGKALTASQVYARDAPGVVFVRAVGVNEEQTALEFAKGEGGEQGVASGSGFEIDSAGTVLTNWHVVANAPTITVGVQSGKTVPAHVVGEDTSTDVAVLRIPTGGLTLHPLVLGRSADVRVGDPVLAIGNPYGLERTLTTGVISARGRTIASPDGAKLNGALQTDAPINPGNSGGPLLNEGGEVIGINSQIETSGGRSGSVGIGFAVPIDAARATVTKLSDRVPQG